MSSKRKSDEEASGRDKKKQKIKNARTIPVQTVPSTSTSTNGITTANPKSSSQLPGSLDVERFVEARAFEIDAMHTAMKTASASSTQRAWQALPRHLRRRAASHDVRRVPLRLRDKAKAEARMDLPGKKTKKISLPKPGKAKQQSRTEKLLKRQRDKTWLETHIWHAKRMQMENLWGYRLAVQPTEKSFRPSHRASKHGSIIHDASYFGVIELKGSFEAIKGLLHLCCDPYGPPPSATRYTYGSRVAETWIYSPSEYPSGLILPVTILWKPSDDTLTKNKPATSKQPGQPNANSTSTSRSTPQLLVTRVVWLFVHPSVFDAVSGIVQSCASAALSRLGNGGDIVHDIEVADLRKHVNIYEIMGPKSNQVLKGALSPVPGDLSGDFKSFWSALGNLQSSASLAGGMVVGCTVNDPRLKFPPKNAKPDPVDLTHQQCPQIFPSSSLARSDIWDESVRLPLQQPKYKKKDIDARKAKNLVPGTPLPPLRQDDRVPILLIQRSVKSPSPNGAEGIHGWMLIVPAGWSMPFFSSLTFTGTRVAGQRERQVQSFEAGVPYFLKDYPTVAACETEVSKVAEEEETRWKRTPAAKKPNYEKLGTRSPWKADWDVVLGLKVEEDEAALLNPDFVTTQREPEPREAPVPVLSLMTPLVVFQPWLLRGNKLLSLLQATPASNWESASLAWNIIMEINRNRAERFQEPFNDLDAHPFFEAALVLVELSMCGRGVLEDMAMIYMMDDDEVRDQLRQQPQTLPEQGDAEKLTPSKGTIIGYVSSGSPSLSIGGSYSIATIAATKYVELLQQMRRLYPVNYQKGQVPKLLVKGRNRDGQVSWPARLRVIPC